MTEANKMNGSATADTTESTEEEVLDPTEIVVSDAETGKKVKVITSANTYAAKKTVAQGMMDIALITANSNQLRYILDFGEKDEVFFTIATFIVISIILQIGVGVCLIFKGRLDMAGDSKHRTANKLNNYVVMGVFLVTIINVFIATFTVNRRKENNSTNN